MKNLFFPFLIKPAPYVLQIVYSISNRHYPAETEVAVRIYVKAKSPKAGCSVLRPNAESSMYRIVLTILV